MLQSVAACGGGEERAAARDSNGPLLVGRPALRGSECRLVVVNNEGRDRNRLAKAGLSIHANVLSLENTDRTNFSQCRRHEAKSPSLPLVLRLTHAQFSSPHPPFLRPLRMCINQDLATKKTRNMKSALHLHGSVNLGKLRIKKLTMCNKKDEGNLCRVP